MNEYHYSHLDVFTEIPFTGNQLAVYLEAEGMSDSLMQKIANEMAFSETTFVSPSNSADYRVRIFTPQTELPMAGHPTIGTIYALFHSGDLSPKTPKVTFELGVGLTPIDLHWDNDKLKLAWMNQPLPEFKEIIEDVGVMAKALQVDKASIEETQLPIQIVSCGVPFLYVPLHSRAAIDQASLNRQALQDLLTQAGLKEHSVFIFSLEKDAQDEATCYSRMFAPSFGIAEDPATGGASGPLGSYLVRYQALTADEQKHFISLQGAKMKRPSEIHISIEGDANDIQSVKVGGAAIRVGEGRLV